MEPSLTRVRVLFVAVLVASLAFAPVLAAAAERGATSGQLMLWLLGLRTPQELKKIDVNVATVDELRAVPGIERRQALLIIAQRPYAKLTELVRAGFSPRLIERLGMFLTVTDDYAGAVPRPSSVPSRR